MEVIRSMYLLLSLIALLLLATNGEYVLSKFWTNLGMLTVNELFLNPSNKQVPYEKIRSAEDMFSKSLDHYPDNQTAIVGIAQIEFLEGFGIRSINAWKNAGVSADDLILLGESSKSRANHSDALKLFNLAAALNPELADPWYYLGSVYDELNDWDTALLKYEFGLERSNFNDFGRSDFLMQMASINRKVEKTDLTRALNLIDQAISLNQFEQDRSKIHAHSIRAAILMQLNQADLAINEYKWVVNQDPTNYWASARLGQLIWKHEEDSIQAESILLSAIDLNQNDTYALKKLAELYKAEQRREDAISTYYKILTIDPNDEAILASLRELEGN